MAAGQLKDRGKLDRRLGRLRAGYPSVVDLYKTQLVEAEGGLSAEWQIARGRLTWREAHESAYSLRTDLQGDSASELCTRYTRLTEAEAAFRVLGGELSIRACFTNASTGSRLASWLAFLGHAV